MSEPSNTLNWRAQLRYVLGEYFSESDLKGITFDLGLDLEIISGDNKVEKIIGIISYFEKSGRINELIDTCKRQRPNVNWDEISQAATNEKSRRKIITRFPTGSMNQGIQRYYQLWALLFFLGILLFMVFFNGWLSFSNSKPNSSEQDVEPPITTPKLDTPTVTSDTELDLSVASNEASQSNVEQIVEEQAIMIPTDQSNITNNNEFPPSSGSVGEIWIRQKDNMVMVFVPEGKFIMGAIDGDPYAETDELPRHEVAMSSFWIDSTEITNLQYTIFLNSNGNLIDDAGYSWYNDKARGAEIESTSDGYHSVEGFEQRPVTFVSWYGAKVYCQWGGGDLPTEAQWEYAARGPENNRFPWGNELPRNLTLNFNDSVGHTTNVGSFPAGVSWVGTFDMAGNVIEWINDWYSARYYENVPIENPSGPPTGQFRSVRGGSWQNSSEYQRSSWRNYIDNPSFRVEDVGFRCVINLKE